MKKENKTMREKLLEMAREEGFIAAGITPSDVPIDGKFRAFCEENLCGNYGANYSCPPDCGTVEQLREKLLAEEQVIVVQTIHEIGGYEDKSGMQRAKVSHNAMVLRLMERIRRAGYEGFCSGYNGCPLCQPCKCREKAPCPHPDQRISCMSAYCIDVAELARRCSLDFAWIPGKLYLFGMIACHRKN